MDIKLRKADLADAKMIFEWRNSSEVRAVSFDSSLIDLKKHLEWFSETIAREDRILLIAMNKADSIGVLRYDLKNGFAEVNVYLNPIFIGKGYGAEILKAGTKWVQKNNPEIMEIAAKIVPDNEASIKAFTKAGYCPGYLTYKKNLSEVMDGS